MKPGIAFIHYSCPPVVGGVEFVLESQSKLFANNGYKVKVIVGKGEKFAPDIEITLIPEIDSTHPLNRKVNEEIKKGDFKEFYRLREKIGRSLKKELKNCNIVICHNILSMPFNLALMAALHQLIPRLKKRFIAWVHDSPLIDPTYRDYIESVPMEKYPWNLLTKPLKSIEYVTISKLRQGQLAEIWGLKKKRIKVIPNGVDIAKFLNLSPQAVHLFQGLKLGDGLTILFPARVIKRKNIELAIRIIKSLSEKGVNPKLIITGPPDPHIKKGKDYFTFLKNLVKKLSLKKEVIFLYDVVDPFTKKRLKVGLKLLRDLYLLSDLLLVTSYQEGFGIPILEAGLVKRPIFTSDIAPLPEVGGREVNYFSLKENPKEIARRIIKFSTSDQASLLFKKIVTQYSWEKIFKERIEPLVLGEKD
ncbi:MAG: glycosyltransferase family 4 protein [Candidatus Omnitrophica bacterium]|nr:glycosyltransferase family 4 protein [Candidatus Omnitrophota bacterium]